MIENSLQEKKEIAWYTSNLNAWIATKMEKDKSLLTISSAAIGFIIILLSRTDLNNFIECLCFFFALFFFVLTVVSIILIFNFNAKHLENVANRKEQRSNILRILDISSSITFTLGIICLVSIGADSIFQSYHKTKKKECTTMNSTRLPDDRFSGKKSLDGISNFDPRKDDDSSKTADSSGDSSKPEGEE